MKVWKSEILSNVFKQVSQYRSFKSKSPTALAEMCSLESVILDLEKDKNNGLGEVHV